MWHVASLMMPHTEHTLIKSVWHFNLKANFFFFFFFFSLFYFSFFSLSCFSLFCFCHMQHAAG